MLFSGAVGATPEGLNGIPAGVWIAMLVMGAVFGFCLNAAGISNRFGKNLLKGQSHQADPDRHGAFPIGCLPTG
ncbi:hypothetical protein D3227_14440 [Mesorhizobium waimense]|uniref:Uncharacterized protein n=1 Tax=Mesorhizobium waimense TaxID=1300307 RepID=A0A3A5L0Z0_9HYPH|nr:hypothetical protein D3227_14440 [Mesorhizobium waimense]